MTSRSNFPTGDRSSSDGEPVDPLPPDVRQILEDRSTTSIEDIREVWTLAGTLEAHIPLDADRVAEMRMSLSSTIDATLPSEEVRAASNRRSEQRQPHRATTGRRTTTDRQAAGRWMRRGLVLSVVLFTVVGLAWGMWPVSIEAPPGETRTAVLPDGTQLEVNSGSVVTYTRLSFGWRNRSVDLAGEAFFDVPTRSTPFQVQTFNANVDVVGTRFGVRSRVSDPTPTTAVVLQEGIVRLSAADSTVQLAPGTAADVIRDGPPSIPRAADVDRRLAWRTGGLAFDGTSMAVILAEAERRYGLRIDASREVLQDSLSVYVSTTPPPNVFLGDLCSLQGCVVDRTATGFRISPGR